MIAVEGACPGRLRGHLPRAATAALRRCSGPCSRRGRRPRTCWFLPDRIGQDRGLRAGARRAAVRGGRRMRGAAGPRALVVTPTRELAVQVRAEFAWLFAGTGARIACFTGGADLAPSGWRWRVGSTSWWERPGGCAINRAGRARCRVGRERGARRGRRYARRGFPRGAARHPRRRSPSERQTLMFSATVGAGGRGAAAALLPTRCGSTWRADRRPRHHLPGGRGRAEDPRGGARQPAAASRAAGGDRVLRPAGGGRAHGAAPRGARIRAVTLSGRSASRTQRGDRRDAGRAGADLRRDRRGGAGLDLPGLDWCCTPTCRVARDPAPPLGPHGTGRAERAAILVVLRGQSAGAPSAGGPAGLRSNGSTAPAAAEVLARDLERMLAEPRDGGRDQEAAAAGRLAGGARSRGQGRRGLRAAVERNRPVPDGAQRAAATLRRRGRPSPSA